MSKTVEERARKYATKRVGGEYIGGFKGDTWLSLYQTYREVATEQRSIDIESACEWLKNKVASFGYAECEDVWDATYVFDTNALIEKFRKAMEGER